MATVYLARDLKHGRPVALKVLRPELAHAVGPERFLREIQIAAGLQHPHILPVHDSGAADGLLWYTMPYVAGESLRHRLEREAQLPLEEAIRIAGEVADALGYAHHQGIVHRDIKPENILLAGGHCFIADFGLAHALEAAGAERLTDSGIAVGTPAYMSPEQASSDARLDGRSDLYSLGCVLYEMLAGEPPFTGRTAQAIIARRFSEPPPRLRTLREVPERVEQVVIQALARAPPHRFATAETFNAARATAPLSLPTGVAPLTRRPGLAAFARAGRVDRARALLAEYEQVRDPRWHDLNWIYGAERRKAALELSWGHIALAERRWPTAIARFQAAVAEEATPAFGLPALGRAYDLTGEIDSAIVVYERYVDAPDVWDESSTDRGTLAIELAGIYRRLSELYRQRGESGKARAYCSRFVELWKDCDPKLRPQVIQARQTAQGRD